VNLVEALPSPLTRPGIARRAPPWDWHGPGLRLGFVGEGWGLVGFEVTLLALLQRRFCIRFTLEDTFGLIPPLVDDIELPQPTGPSQRPPVQPPAGMQRRFLGPRAGPCTCENRPPPWPNIVSPASLREHRPRPCACPAQHFS
jgi:hypothetical protein